MRYGHDSPENGPHRCYTSARDAAAVADHEAAQLVAAERDDWTERFDVTSLPGRAPGRWPREGQNPLSTR
jgi:hypothetical protein